MLTLYTLWRSTSSCGARFVPARKGRDYTSGTIEPVAGAQVRGGYPALNPIKSVPTLVLDNDAALAQSGTPLTRSRQRVRSGRTRFSRPSEIEEIRLALPVYQATLPENQMDAA